MKDNFKQENLAEVKLRWKNIIEDIKIELIDTLSYIKMMTKLFSFVFLILSVVLILGSMAELLMEIPALEIIGKNYAFEVNKYFFLSTIFKFYFLVQSISIIIIIWLFIPYGLLGWFFVDSLIKIIFWNFYPQPTKITRKNLRFQKILKNTVMKQLASITTIYLCLCLVGGFAMGKIVGIDKRTLVYFLWVSTIGGVFIVIFGYHWGVFRILKHKKNPNYPKKGKFFRNCFFSSQHFIRLFRGTLSFYFFFVLVGLVWFPSFFWTIEKALDRNTSILEKEWSFSTRSEFIIGNKEFCDILSSYGLWIPPKPDELKESLNLATNIYNEEKKQFLLQNELMECGFVLISLTGFLLIAIPSFYSFFKEDGPKFAIKSFVSNGLKSFAISMIVQLTANKVYPDNTSKFGGYTVIFFLLMSCFQSRDYRKD